MKKKVDLSMLISSFICVLPIILAVTLYNDLPENIAIHWDSSSNPDSYVTKALAAFGLPIIMLVINLFVHLNLNNDPKKANSSAIIKTIGKWISPIISVILVPLTLLIAMGSDIKLNIVIPAVLGVIIVICGNYLPKCKQNYTVGIKLPWTLNSEENWNKTHHLSGYVWTIGGFVIIASAFLSIWYIKIIVIALIVIIPFVYSFALYKKGV